MADKESVAMTEMNTRSSKEIFLDKLRAAKTTEEWNAICDEVKDYTQTLLPFERSGEYPAWWYPEVIASGLASRVLNKEPNREIRIYA